MARWMQQTTLPTLAMLTWEQVGSGRCWWLNDQDISLTFFWCWRWRWWWWLLLLLLFHSKMTLFGLLNYQNSSISYMLFSFIFVIWPKDCWHYSWSSAAPVERSPLEESNWLPAWKPCVGQHRLPNIWMGISWYINFKQWRFMVYHWYIMVYPRCSMYGIFTYIYPKKSTICRWIFHTWSIWVYGGFLKRIKPRHHPVVMDAVSDPSDSRSHSRHELPCGRTPV